MIHELEGRDVTVHELKTVPPYFGMVYYGEKTAELRKHDRNFQQYDHLRLREWDPENQRYTGNEVIAEIINIVTDADGPWLARDHCMLSLRILELVP